MSDPAGWLLVSDIDDTLTGDDAAMVRLGRAIGAAGGRLRFAVNSSRPAGSVAETLREVFPPQLRPDAVITALGTEIAVEGKMLASWQERFAGWPHAEIRAALEDLGHRPHPEIYQTPRKVSFAVPPGAQDQARAALAPYPCRIIASGRDDFDVIPAGAGKGAATLHLAEALGVAPERIVVAGDSGNDLAMFEVTGNAIAVGNAREELLQALAPGVHYRARALHAAGVLEGLRHYGVLPAEEAEA
jgi:sucrose-6F-phosphate phosphohydrolase